MSFRVFSVFRGSKTRTMKHMKLHEKPCFLFVYSVYFVVK